MAACEGCTCGRADAAAAGTSAPEQTYVTPITHAYDREPRSFTDPAEGVYAPVAETRGGLAVPLRSKKWFSDMDHPGACVLQDSS